MISCETRLSECTPTTCLNDGVCYIDASTNSRTLRCICPQEFSGQFCETPIIDPRNPCSKNPCGPHGTCIHSSDQSYECFCQNGLSGLTCNQSRYFHYFSESIRMNFISFLAIPISCNAAPCHHLSTCQQITDNETSLTATCHCPSYLTGDRCQYANRCQNQPCLNQGTCLPLGPQNSFLCLCQPGFGHYDCSMCKLLPIITFIVFIMLLCIKILVPRVIRMYA